MDHMERIGPKNPPERMGWMSTLIIEVQKKKEENEVIMVVDDDKPLPHYPKLSGGKREMPLLEDGTGVDWGFEPHPGQTLYREILEELPGLSLDEGAFYLSDEGPIYKERVKRHDGRTHMFYTWAFIILQDNARNIKPGKEIKEVVRVPVSEMKYDFLGKGKILPQTPWLVSRTTPAWKFWSNHEMALYKYFIMRASEKGDEEFITYLQDQIYGQKLPIEKMEAITMALNKFGHGLS